jgi:hypothetical protein
MEDEYFGDHHCDNSRVILIINCHRSNLDSIFLFCFVFLGLSSTLSMFLSVCIFLFFNTFFNFLLIF